MEYIVDAPLVRDVARTVLAQAAPEEMPLFRTASEVYFADPRRALARRRQQQELLGFGGEAVVALLTPVVLAVTTDVLNHLVGVLVRDASTRGAAAARAGLRRLFRLDSPNGAGRAVDVPPISPQQLAIVRGRAFDKAIALDLPEAKAELLADALVGALTKTG